MRQITRSAVRAFRNNEKFKRDNTEVISGASNTPCLFLHGHCIAARQEEGTLWVRHAGWDTPTTKDRLNGVLSAVGCQGIYQKAGQWYWADGNEFIDGWQEAREHANI
jgi:hypothetical protein